MRSETFSRPSSPFGLPAGPVCAAPSPAIDRRGLVLGDGTCLTRFGRDGGLALNADRERVLTLLSVAAGRPVPAAMLAPLAAASEHWRRGDRALANLRLVFAGLPRLATATDIASVRDAADILDGGMAPRALMKALGFDASALDKFDPDQPRVPAGSGPTSGRWTDRAGGDTDEANGLIEGRSAGRDETQVQPQPSRFAPSASIIPVAADGPIQPGGLVVVPHTGVDPQNLNTPSSPAEQQTIADTMNAIVTGKLSDLSTLYPHYYRNDPDPTTGAQLPIGGSYTTQYVRSSGSPAGTARIVTEAGGSVYYTNNHYMSFYPADIVRKSHAKRNREADLRHRRFLVEGAHRPV